MSLHDAIKQIHPIPPLGANINQHLSFKEGHKQARHAAAELAIASDARIEVLEAALQKISDWKSHSSEFSVDHGSNGVRDFYRLIAKQALKGQP